MVESDTNNAIRFPLVNGVEAIGESSFEETCLLAAETGRPLHLTSDVVVKDIIRLRKQQKLHIFAEKQNRNVAISGDVHSIFILNNSSQLILNNIDLHHTIDSSLDHKQVGAAVNLRYKSSLKMCNGQLSSTCGFCCWAVQKSSAGLLNVQLTANLRSPVVCFGQPTCSLDGCTISNAGVHAICGRGACQITLSKCRIKGSTARAIYAYSNASVVLRDTLISDTKRKDKAAVEVSSAGGSSSSITVQNCQIVDNNGIGLLLRGEVVCELTQDNTIERNGGGNMKRTASLQDDDTPAVGTSGTIMKRDPSGSSFRTGDWWCDKCKPRQVVIAKQTNCPRCEAPFVSKDQFLTVKEIFQFNQGIFFDRPSPRWFFDGDEKGWLPYDDESNKKLEEVFQGRDTGSIVVILAGGKYQVDIQKMEQMNMETQFLRFVKREP